MEIENAKNKDVKNILSLNSPVGFKVVFLPNNYDNDKHDNNDKMYFRVYDILHFAIIKTADEKIRHCFCYLGDYSPLTWIDEDPYFNLDKTFIIINYDNYVSTMSSLGQKPLNLHNYIIQCFNFDIVTPPRSIYLNCSIDNFKSHQNKLISNFELVQIQDGYYNYE